jgi:hypothetical protein
MPKKNDIKDNISIPGDSENTENDSKKISKSDVELYMKSISKDDFENLISEIPQYKEVLTTKSAEMVNNATKHELNIFPEKDRVIEDGKDRTGIEVWVPGTGIKGGVKPRPVFKIVAKCDYESKLKKQGFMTKEEFLKHSKVNELVVMYTKTGERVDALRSQVGVLMRQGLFMENPLGKK